MASRDPRRRALRTTDEELDKAAEVTPDDLAALDQRAPEAVRKYLRARPESEEEKNGDA